MRLGRYGWRVGFSTIAPDFQVGFPFALVKTGIETRRIHWYQPYFPVKSLEKHLANNQNFINEAAEFLVFCADLKRSSMCCELHNAQATEGFTEQFIITTVDAALAAQNVVVAAESAGLGIAMLGL